MLSSRLVGTGRNAKIAVALAAALWGLYWLPLRAMDEQGITGAWATLAFYLGPAVLFAPLAALRWRRLIAGGRGLFLTAFVTTLALVFYANALIFTEVVRAVLLVYLTPVWSTLFARAFLGEPITRLRLVSIAPGDAERDQDKHEAGNPDARTHLRSPHRNGTAMARPCGTLELTERRR